MLALSEWLRSSCEGSMSRKALGILLIGSLVSSERSQLVDGTVAPQATPT
jgi:hypothetical protein